MSSTSKHKPIRIKSPLTSTFVSTFTLLHHDSKFTISYTRPFQHSAEQLGTSFQSANLAHSDANNDSQSYLNEDYPKSSLPTAIVNSQNKPKVSSPAPSKIYGRPTSVATDQLKIGTTDVMDRSNSGK